MESSHAWIEYLNIPTSNLEEWKAEAPEDIPLLVWCLREGKISFKKYASWAKNHYSLPVIHPEFFSNHPPVENLSAADWTPWMVPVATWESVTYIGCVMPPPDPEEGFVYLLANPMNLCEVYSNLEKHLEETPQEQEVEDLQDSSYQMPDGLILDLKSPMTPPSHSPEGLTLNFELPNAEEVVQAAEPEAAEPEAPPEEELTIPFAPPAPKTQANLSLPEAALTGWWKETQQVFSHAVLLEASESGFNVLWKDGGVAPVVTLSASKPSLFRIALRTEKPYHGFVIENEIHNQFFDHLGAKGYPSCVTALLVEGSKDTRFIACFFGFIGKEGVELNLAESLSKQLNLALKKNSTFNQAA